MAHPKSKRMSLRSAYCFKAQTLEQAAVVAGVSVGTARRWKADALHAEDDDWDKIRAASNLAGEGMEAVTRQMLNDYVIQHRSLMEQIAASDLSTEARVEALSSLADSFAKTISASKRVLPETDQLATALDVIRKLAEFTRQHFPQYATVILELMEPFGEAIAKEYGR